MSCSNGTDIEKDWNSSNQLDPAYQLEDAKAKYRNHVGLKSFDC
jgi:hypothetical protein